MIEVIRLVTTPLALAALALLILAGFIKAIVQKQGPANVAAKLTIHYSFILAIVLSVLANLVYMVEASFRREVLFTGNVQDEKGNPLKGAYISVVGGAGAMSDSNGTFAIPLPDSRSANQYKVQTRLAGFSPNDLDIQGPRPVPFSVKLQPITLTASDFVRFSGNIQVSHILGSPLVVVKLTWSNPLPNPLALTNVSMVLTAPDGQEYTVRPEKYFTEDAPLPPMPFLMPTIHVSSGTQAQMSYSFRNSPDQNVQQLIFGAETIAFQNGIKYDDIPNPSRNLFSPQMVADFVRIMDRDFIWKAGQWNVRIEFWHEQRKFAASAAFVLSQEQVTQMSKISEQFASGIGVLNLPSFRNWFSPGSRSAITVPLTSKN